MRNELGSDSAVRDLRAAADALALALLALLDQAAADGVDGESTAAPVPNGSAVEPVAVVNELDIEDNAVAVCGWPDALAALDAGAAEDAALLLALSAPPAGGCALLDCSTFCKLN